MKKKWMPLSGNFIENENSVVFQGNNQSNTDHSSLLNTLVPQLAPSGMVLYDDIISCGSIEATIEFEKFDRGDLGQIVFNYQNYDNYMCAGVGNTAVKFGINVINGSVSNTISATGFMDALPVKRFDMTVCMMGSYLELWVNSIRVLTSPSPFPISPSQVGVLVKSNGKVTISNFKANYQKPEAFIVSQFGGDYDILYSDVIEPVCDRLGYKPIRGDEIASCSMIINDIADSIRNATVIVADISPDNPNVFYEVGFAHALNKPTILLCEKSIREKLPFDVSGFRTIFYDNSIGGKKKVEEKLGEYLRKISILIMP